MRLVIESRAGEVVGAVDIFDFDPQNLRAGVGIVVGADFRRRGYALDALNTLEWYAREVLHLRQLWCSVTADNSASRQLFQRAGYAECGLRRSWILTPNGELDEVLYQKLL
jgi:diamine N-acetyltransferase